MTRCVAPRLNNFLVLQRFFLFIHASFTRRVRSGALRAQHRQVDATCRQLALQQLHILSSVDPREKMLQLRRELVEAPGLHLGKVDAIDKPLPRIRQVELRTPPLARVRSAAVKEPRIEDDGGARSSRRLEGPVRHHVRALSWKRPRASAMILWHGYLDTLLCLAPEVGAEDELRWAVLELNIHRRGVLHYYAKVVPKHSAHRHMNRRSQY